MILAATGHRPDKLGGYSPDVSSMLRRLAASCIGELRPDQVISGMALGWDIAVAEAALLAGVPLTAAVPCRDQDVRWPPEARERYRRILARASRVHVVSPGAYSPAKMQRRNVWMVDRCDLLLALWDGSRGGTANCLAYADLRGRPYRNAWGLWRGVVHMDGAKQ